MDWFQQDIRELADAEYARYYALMAAEKRQRVDRFRFPEDKKRSVAADMLARRAVAARCGAAEEEIVFALGPHGKPFARGRDVEFSVSHSGFLAVCAVDSRPVGIDVEEIRPINLVTARRVCTAEELLFLFGHPPEASEFVRTEDPALLDRFYRLWTEKEAYGKWSGIGIFRDGFPRPASGYRTFRQGDYCISIFQNPADAGQVPVKKT